MPLKPQFVEFPFFRPPADPGAVITNFNRKPPHLHCPTCWGEDFRVNANNDAFCNRCSPAPQMLVCTPIICPSS